MLVLPGVADRFHKPEVVMGKQYGSFEIGSFAGKTMATRCNHGRSIVLPQYLKQLTPPNTGLKTLALDILLPPLSLSKVRAVHVCPQSHQSYLPHTISTALRESYLPRSLPLHQQTVV
ncbi:hypothetical protein RRG08_034185 [Elysia crispata]|uniref:Uncharacterized protein n=1 Tax=Elysia crispata TaxID=231223 RepID=A0AAE1BA01_9GAST|nr:hypothetical protein RRG08_034185 [Elysia crispata]